MVNYANSKIYAIRSHKTDEIYIGSTLQPLYMRLSAHKRNYKRYKNGSYHYVSSYKILEYEDAYIELIEDYPCERKEELNRREGQYIRSMDCVNKLVAGRSSSEYREDNKEKIATRMKEYRELNKEKLAAKNKEYRENNREQIAARSKEYNENNKEQIAARSKEKIICECGTSINRGVLAKHKRTQKHIKAVEMAAPDPEPVES